MTTSDRGVVTRYERSWAFCPRGAAEDHEWSALDLPLTIDERSMLEFVARDMRGIRALRLITG